MSTDPVALVDDALDKLAKLDRLCCEPGRSPRMAELRETLDGARVLIESGADPVPMLEAAGAQVGRLQVGCCAPARMPLYAGILEDLMETQRAAGPGMH